MIREGYLDVKIPAKDRGFTPFKCRSVWLWPSAILCSAAVYPLRGARGHATFGGYRRRERRLLDQEDFSLGDQHVPVEPARQNITLITLWSAPHEMSHDVVKDVLSAYGTIRKIEHEEQQYRPKVCTGNRRVCMDMRTPVPNFSEVNGFRATCNYPGMRCLYRHCDLEGHLLAQCQSPQCGICLMYGHVEDTCSVSCSICSGGHMPSRCPRRVATYAMVAVGPPSVAWPKRVRAKRAGATAPPPALSAVTMGGVLEGALVRGGCVAVP
ncbi:uncharacterized protein LOC143236565 [Tachypleus tridentatus]|uniref:uncharacterized protein LOC143236565 n=1 Tax=Tachypleus tridentatus TaxID=6853 RepID=UPI003FD171D9